MAEEHTTETREPDGTTHRHTTIVTDGAQNNGGSSKWLLVLVALVGAGAIVYFVSMGSQAEVAKDNAVAEAADQVGETAQQIGTAVDNVSDQITSAE